MKLPVVIDRAVRSLRAGLVALAGASDGNVILMAAAAAVPLVFAVGFGVDYGHAKQIETKLDAIADSAALIAVSASSIDQSDTSAQTAATNLFNLQAGQLSGVTVTGLTITTPTTYNGSLVGSRVATVTYQANVKTWFSGILGRSTMPITGTSQADASQPPSINFYVVMDLSPSMLLPTASSGITNLSSATTNSVFTAGCDFACHTQHPEEVPAIVADASGNTVLLAASYYSAGINGTAGIYRVNTSSGNVYNASGTLIGINASCQTQMQGYGGNYNCFTYQAQGYRFNNPVLTYKASPGGATTNVSVSYADSFWLAENYGKVYNGSATIPLRIDAETTAAQNLITYAASVEATVSTGAHPVSYQMQFFTFNYSTPTALTAALADVSTMSTASIPNLASIAPYLYTYFYWTSSSTATNDADTDFTTMFNSMNQSSTMATPGSGASPSSPQAVMFLVTDGMADMTSSGSTCQTSNRACTQLISSQLAQCTAIKARGIRIAVLYTQYMPSTIQNPALPFGNTVASTAVPNIQAALQSCSSTNPDGSSLFYQVNVDQDISAALNSLFAMAVKTAYLAK